MILTHELAFLCILFFCVTLQKQAAVESSRSFTSDDFKGALKWSQPITVSILFVSWADDLDS